MAEKITDWNWSRMGKQTNKDYAKVKPKAKKKSLLDVFHIWQKCGDQPSNYPGYPTGPPGTVLVHGNSWLSPTFFNTPALAAASTSWYNDHGAPNVGEVINLYIDSNPPGPGPFNGDIYNVCWEYLGLEPIQTHDTQAFDGLLIPGVHYSYVSTHANCSLCAAAPLGIPISGCMDPAALNYDPSATADCNGVVGASDTSCCEYPCHKDS